MHKIKVMDSNQQYEGDGKKFRILEIDDAIFEIGIRKGLIEENEDGYYFIGDYEELLAFTSERTGKKLKLLD